MKLRGKLTVLCWVSAFALGTASPCASAPAQPAPDDDALAPVVALPSTVTGAGTQVIVEPGDCLWNLAKARLDHPTNAQTLAATLAWYAANEDVIGADPNLIVPGQVLDQPPEQE